MVTSITYTPDIGLKVVRFNVDSVQNIDGYEAKGFMASEESVLKATGVDVPSPAGPDISVDEDAPEFPADVVQMHPQEQEAAVNKLLEQYEGASPERRQQLSVQIRSIQSALNSMLWQKVGGYAKQDKFHIDLLVQSMKEDDDFVTCDVEEHRVLEALLNKEWKNG